MTNYLGIQYATIPARFRQSQPINLSDVTGVLDATHYGPRCPQISLDQAETAHLYDGVRRSAEYPLDEFGCLRLNIYVPHQRSGESDRGSGLPVVVWIHGGGFIFGDGNSEYDGNYLVQHSVQQGMPIIFVALNYRLGFFGFLTSRELREESEASGETVFSNMGMRDQRVALLWVQQHISHFGGDADNVTIAGESAGGWSVLAHLRSDVPVCQRGFILSSPNLDFPRREEAQETFDELVAAAGVGSDALAGEKLAALRKLDSMEVVKLMGPRFATPNWDENWFVYQDGKKPIAGPAPFGPWVKAVITGSTRDEAAIFGLTQWQKWTAQQFADRVSSSFSDPHLARELASAYCISTDANPKDCLAGFIAMASDSIFSGLPFTLAESSSPTCPVSVYRFDQADTFPHTPLKGYAYHALDNAFFCRLPAVAGPKAERETRETADRLSEVVLEFARGKQPWPGYHEEQRIFILVGMQTRTQRVVERDRWRKVTMVAGEARAKGTWRSGNKLLGIRHCSMDKS